MSNTTRMRFQVRPLTATKIAFLLLCAMVALMFLRYLLFVQRECQISDRKSLQEGSTSGMQLSRPLLSGENATDQTAPPPRNVFASVPICSRHEPIDLSLCLATSEATSGAVAGALLERRCRPEYEIYQSRRRRCISYDMLQRMNVNRFDKARRPAIYSIYPLDVPLPIILQAVRSNSPISTAPINNPKLVLIRTSQSICRINDTHGRARHELIIIVKSSPAHAARRVRLRRLISKQTSKFANSVGLLFSVGLPPDNANRSRLLETLSNEATRFDDIIFANFTDTYYNLTLKTLLNLRFAHVACGAASPLFAFMDDDHGLNLTALLDFFHRFDEEKGHRDQLQRSIFGHIHKRPKVIRAAGNKWAVTRSEMPFDLYPDFAAGPCYFIGAEAVASLSIATAFTKPFTLEDVYVGLTATKLGIKMYDIPDVYLHGPPQDKTLPRAPLIASLEYFEAHFP